LKLQKNKINKALEKMKTLFRAPRSEEK
jgi:hypothetical protein